VFLAPRNAHSPGDQGGEPLKNRFRSEPVASPNYAPTRWKSADRAHVAMTRPKLRKEKSTRAQRKARASQSGLKGRGGWANVSHLYLGLAQRYFNERRPGVGRYQRYFYLQRLKSLAGVDASTGGVAPSAFRAPIRSADCG